MMTNGSDSLKLESAFAGTTTPIIAGPRSVPPLSRPRRLLSWALQLTTVGILFQTLFFKFSGAEESVYIFSVLGLEPWGRIGSGMAELIACFLLVVPRTVAIGALLSLGVISGAIVSHLTKLGIVVKGDGGLLFALALIVFACSLGTLAIRRAELFAWGQRTGAVRKAAHVN